MELRIRKQDLASLKAQADEIKDLVKQGLLTPVDQNNLLGLIYRQYQGLLAEDEQRNERIERIVGVSSRADPQDQQFDVQPTEDKEDDMSLSDIMGRIAAHSQRIDDMAAAMQQAARPSTNRFGSGISSPDDLANAALAHVCESAATLMVCVAHAPEAAGAQAVRPHAVDPSQHDVVDVEAREIKP